MTRRALDRLVLIAVALAAVLTAVFPTWIESVLGIDPDGGSGALESLVLALACAVALACLLWLARDLRASRGPRR